MGFGFAAVPAQTLGQVFHGHVEGRRQEQGEHLREDESAHGGDAERPARLDRKSVV